MILLKNWLNSDFGRLRLASLLDGISWVILAGIAVPLKWIWGHEEAVRYPGMAHGLFFVLLCITLFIVWVSKKLSFKWCAMVMICALIPFAPFFLDRRLKTFHDDEARQNQ